MSRELYFFLMICVAGAVTIALRALPFIMFGRGERSPETVKFIGKVLSPGAIAMLVVYCLCMSCRDFACEWAKCGLPELTASLTVIALQLYKHNPLISIICGTAVYMFMVQNL